MKRNYIFEITVRTQDGDKPYRIMLGAESMEEANRLLTDAMNQSTRVEDLDKEVFTVIQ